jgi:hypothetical protein
MSLAMTLDPACLSTLLGASLAGQNLRGSGPLHRARVLLARLRQRLRNIRIFHESVLHSYVEQVMGESFDRHPLLWLHVRLLRRLASSRRIAIRGTCKRFGNPRGDRLEERARFDDGPDVGREVTQDGIRFVRLAEESTIDLAATAGSRVWGSFCRALALQTFAVWQSPPRCSL